MNNVIFNINPLLYIGYIGLSVKPSVIENDEDIRVYITATDESNRYQTRRILYKNSVNDIFRLLEAPGFHNDASLIIQEISDRFFDDPYIKPGK